MSKIKTRLYCPSVVLETGHLFELLDSQAHYIRSVMRCQIGDLIGIFNGVSGEYACQIIELNKKTILLSVQKQIKEHLLPENIAVIFAVIKKNPLEYMIQKATELGVGAFLPIITDHTVIRDINQQRLEQIAIEAAEQCGLTAVPVIKQQSELKEAIKNYHNVLFCDERSNGISLKNIMKNSPMVFDAVLIGPEGGFSSAEAEYLRYQNNIYSVSLGKRIMRAETATVAVISALQLIYS